jgi:hypothetical protein
MPIRPFLAGQPFDPDTIEAMSAAFTDACATLGLADRDDPITRVVSEHIIQLAQRGVRTKTALYSNTVEVFSPNPS